MIVKVFASRGIAVAALCQHLDNADDPSVNKKAKFNTIVKDYIQYWGGTNEDVHVAESNSKVEAELIVEKYYW